MHIFKNLTRCFLLIILCTMLTPVFIYAQNSDASGTYSPYSFYGVGTLTKPGFAYNKAMGGIGYGLRTNKLINYLNPAAINKQDSLSFLFDFGGELQNYYISSSEQSTAANSFNLDHIAFSFPIWKKMAAAVAVMPYSHVGYDISREETDPDVIVETGSTQYSYVGEGGLNQFIVSFASGIGERLSVGVHGQYIFGSIDRYYNIYFGSSAIHPIYNTSSLKASSYAFTLGAQYELPINKDYQAVLGATYQFRNNMKVDRTDFTYITSSIGTDTIRFQEQPNARLLVPSSLGLGFSIQKQNKWLAGFDYTYQDWRSASFDAPSSGQLNFKATPSHSFRGGFEYIPNMYDIRYFMRRISYRAGLYYEKTYMQFTNSTTGHTNQIKDYGVTFGVGVPLGRYSHNAVNIGAEIGQRGTTNDGLLREFYWKVSLSISLYDIWFVKPRYD